MRNHPNTGWDLKMNQFVNYIACKRNVGVHACQGCFHQGCDTYHTPKEALSVVNKMFAEKQICYL